MARDYAKKSKQKKYTAVPRSILGLSFLAAVLVIGFAASLWFLQMNTQHSPVKRVTAKKAPHTQKTKRSPRFEFYTLLPSGSRHRQSATEVPSQQFSLQIASLKNAKDADRLKAELTLLGFDVRVIQYKKRGHAYNRVKVGPYATRRQVLAAQKSLKQNHYRSIVTTQ
jgi:cell division protein FtsN